MTGTDREAAVTSTGAGAAALARLAEVQQTYPVRTVEAILNVFGLEPPEGAQSVNSVGDAVACHQQVDRPERLSGRNAPQRDHPHQTSCRRPRGQPEGRGPK
jgi:hypothetical protein